MAVASWAPRLRHDLQPAVVDRVKNCEVRTRPKRLWHLPPCILALLRTRAGTHASPTPLPLHTLRDDGQTRQVGGLVGRCGETGREANAVCGKGGSGKADNQCALPSKLGGRREQPMPQIRAGTSTTPSGHPSRHHIGHEPCLRLSGGFLLPTMPMLVGLRFFLRRGRGK